MPIRLITDSFPADPALDTATSRALMLRVAAGELPETVRISRPGPMVAFGKRDVVAPGYPHAVSAARAGGFEAIERLAGGRAVAFHEDTISFGHAIPDADPRSHVDGRFEATAALIVAALGRLGIDARLGEIPGEYCPGAHSVNAGGERKLMGVGQRLVSGGAYVGGLIVVAGGDRLNEILTPVYTALNLPWRPEATGAVADEAPGTTWEDMKEALIAEYEKRYGLTPAELDEETLTLAKRLAPEHRSPDI